MNFGISPIPQAMATEIAKQNKTAASELLKMLEDGTVTKIAFPIIKNESGSPTYAGYNIIGVDKKESIDGPDWINKNILELEAQVDKSLGSD